MSEMDHADDIRGWIRATSLDLSVGEKKSGEVFTLTETLHSSEGRHKYTPILRQKRGVATGAHIPTPDIRRYQLHMP